MMSHLFFISGVVWWGAAWHGAARRGTGSNAAFFNKGTVHK
jgi:hypothetical protein